MRIVQLSDIHVGSGLFKPDLLVAAIEETNALAPDLVAVAGDLTTEGYRHEFEEVRAHLDRLACPNIVVVMGNHDARNVGYRHFEDFFGARERAVTIAVPEGEAKLVALDTTKPDLDEGEVGREHYGWIDAEFRGWDRGPRILVIHHHILAVPGTGRDRNSLRDAGDVMAPPARAQRRPGARRSPARPLCVEHRRRPGDPLRHRLEPATSGNDAALLQPDRGRPRPGPRHHARAWSAGRGGAARKLRPGGGEDESVLSSVRALRPLREAALHGFVLCTGPRTRHGRHELIASRSASGAASWPRPRKRPGLLTLPPRAPHWSSSPASAPET
jgi:hypothetical protein